MRWFLWMPICKTIQTPLLGRQALTALASYAETNLFLRGLIPKLGFPSARIFYDCWLSALSVNIWPKTIWKANGGHVFY